MTLLVPSQVLTTIHQLASQNKYSRTKHAKLQQIQRNLSDEEIHNILLNAHTILRTDTNNIDGITSYKIEGGLNNHRLAIKILHTDKWISIITAMDNEQ
ncbi:hypothetical protein ACFQZE_07240 [Paenibacillus sp. GCM10027627]|uniref:hypothetical protein n=1 Tax=unclassified Paenibacillus TaxID=185978 RepID=UPI003628ACF2